MSAPSFTPSVAPRLYLVRHAESTGNACGVVQGSGQYPLTRLGRSQASAARSALRTIAPDLVVSSDLVRAMQTARLASGRLDLVDSRLREQSAGSWEGRTRAEFEAEFPGALSDDRLRPPDFESAPLVVARMHEVCRELLALHAVVVAFTHGGAMRLFSESLGAGRQRFDHLEALELSPGVHVVSRRHLVRGRLR